MKKLIILLLFMILSCTSHKKEQPDCPQTFSNGDVVYVDSNPYVVIHYYCTYEQYRLKTINCNQDYLVVDINKKFVKSTND